MCLGGHLAFRCALDNRVSAGVCYFATDLHSHTLAEGMKDDSLERAGEVAGELVMIFGKKDNHVSPEGRDLIRKTLHEKGVVFSWYEVAWAQRKFFLSFGYISFSHLFLGLLNPSYARHGYRYLLRKSTVCDCYSDRLLTRD